MKNIGLSLFPRLVGDPSSMVLILCKSGMNLVRDMPHLLFLSSLFVFLPSHVAVSLATVWISLALFSLGIFLKHTLGSSSPLALLTATTASACLLRTSLL